MNKEKIKSLLLQAAETDKVEFKTSFTDEVIVSLVAFSNAKGGTVYVGVGNDGAIIGVQLQKETTAQWLNEIRTKTAPILIPDVEVLEMDEKTVVSFSIDEYPIKPVAVKGRYYKRVRNTNQLLEASDVMNLHLQSMNSSWDAFSDTTHSIDDLSLEKVQVAIETMKNHGVTINEAPLAFLLKYNLLRADKPTNAAYLMFKKDDSFLTTIELGRFQDAITIKDSARTKADILSQVEQVLEYVKKHINMEVIITGEAQNTQRWEYPLEAIREIVLNMIVHRDYRASSDSIVKIFNDKIEFYNPGRLPDDISINDLLSNNYKSTPRNKLIADFCKDLGWIEKYGSGIQRILNQFKDYGLPAPEFRQISEGFQVMAFAAEKDIEDVTEGTVEKTVEETVEKTVPKESTEKTVEKTVKKTVEKTIPEESTEKTVEETVEKTVEKTVPEESTEKTVEETVEKTVEKTVPEESTEKTVEKTVEKILELIQKNPTITQSELVETIGLTRRGVEWNISKLKEQGLLERVGPDKGGYWRINIKETL